MFKLVSWICILQACSASNETSKYLENFEITDESSCNQIVQLGLDITYQFFKDQFSLVVIDFSHFSSKRSVNSLKCITDDHYRPRVHYDTLEHVQLPPSVRKNTYSTYPTTEGFILQASLDEVRRLLKIVSTHNPMAKTLIMQVRKNELEARELLSEAFHVYKMLKVAVMMFGEIFEEGELVQWTVSLMMYNPFVETTEKFTIFEFDNEAVEILFGKIENYMDQRTGNLNGFGLTISMFEYPMLSKRNVDERGRVTHYSYADGEMVRTLSKFMNFSIKYIESSGYGFQYPNGTFDGSLADIEEGRADLAPNLKFIANYNTSNLIFLQPITEHQLTFYIRKRKTTKPFIFSAYEIFDEATSTIIMIMNYALPTIYMIVNRLEQKLLNLKNKKSPIDSFGKTFLNVFSLANNVAIDKPPRNRSARILLSMMLFYSLIMSALFQSTILKNLNTNLQVGKIKTIQQLADEGYKIKMPAIYAMMFKEPGQNKVSLMLNQTNQSYIDTGTWSTDLKQILPPDQKIAYLWSNLYKGNYLNRFYDEKTGDNLFESVPEVAFQFYIAQTAPKHSPFVENFNLVLLRYMSTGMGSCNIKQAFWDNDKVWMKRVRDGKIPKKRSGAIALKDVAILFEIFLALNAVSCAVFMMEILVWKLKNLKK